MNAAIVVDASVVIKWVLNEPGREHAAALLDEYEGGRIDLIAPRLLMTEVASALSKRCRRKELSPKGAEQAFRLIEARRPLLTDEPGELRFALSFSLERQVSVFDALYVGLAILRRCDFVTADRRLYRSVARHYPFARLLSQIT
jgi:predicted nucleic acid-binding protein